jgi:COX assembly mitochondrial protein 2
LKQPGLSLQATKPSSSSSSSSSMHPPLDRPHPDCQNDIEELRECHLDPWKKFLGGCNEIKTRLDHCLRAEKKRLLDEMNLGLVDRKAKEQDMIKEAFGRKETFAEYLEKDRDFQNELRKKLERQEAS